MGCTISSAVTTTQSPLLEQMPAETVLIGDLEDLERDAADCDLLITHSHGRQAAERLHVPLFRMGIPMFDRLGAGHLVLIGYRGTRDMVFAIGNLFMAVPHKPNPDTWRQGAANHGDTPVETHRHAVNA
jgi:nitrogenase molybdenum-iron protein NifN